MMRLLLLLTMTFSVCNATGQETGNAVPARRITLQDAVQLALKHNHDIRIAGYSVEEKRQAKEIAKSSYFPSIRNDSSFMHATDTELIQVRAGSFGNIGR
jgi:outer membrane protein TolC